MYNYKENILDSMTKQYYDLCRLVTWYHKKCIVFLKREVTQDFSNIAIEKSVHNRVDYVAKLQPKYSSKKKHQFSC